jgi:hypothetical protein
MASRPSADRMAALSSDLNLSIVPKVEQFTIARKS